MPGGDGTGPMGMGPMTGRAAGYCAGYGVPGYANPMLGGGGWGGGRGFGAWGRGRGRRHRFYATGLTGWQRAAFGGLPGAYAMPVAAGREQELDALKAQADYFNGALEDIRARIAELETAKEKE